MDLMDEERVCVMRRLQNALEKFCVLSAGALALLTGGAACALLSVAGLSGVWYAVGALCGAYAGAIVFTFVRAALSRA